MTSKQSIHRLARVRSIGMTWIRMSDPKSLTDHEASNKPANPLWEKIQLFILHDPSDLRSVILIGSSQRKAPLLAEKVHGRLYSSDKTSTESNQSTFKPCFTDTSLLDTVCFVPGEKSPYVFSINFNPLNSDIPLIRTLSKAPSVSLLMGFDCIKFLSCFCSNRAWSFQNYAKITLLYVKTCDYWVKSFTCFTKKLSHALFCLIFSEKYVHFLLWSVHVCLSSRSH